MSTKVNQPAGGRGHKLRSRHCRCDTAVCVRIHGARRRSPGFPIPTCWPALMNCGGCAPRFRLARTGSGPGGGSDAKAACATKRKGGGCACLL